AGPQSHPLPGLVVVEAGAAGPPGTPMLLHHRVDDRVSGMPGPAAPGGLDATPGLVADLAHQVHVQLVDELQHRRWVAGLRAGLLDGCRGCTLGEHGEGFVDEGADDPAGEKAAAVVDDDRGFAD